MREEDLTLIKCHYCKHTLYVGYAKDVTASHGESEDKMYMVDASWRVVSSQMKQEGARVQGVETGAAEMSKDLGIEYMVCRCPDERCGKEVSIAVERVGSQDMTQFAQKVLFFGHQVDAMRKLERLNGNW